MDSAREDMIKQEIDELRARFEAVSMQNADLSRAVLDASRMIAVLSSELELIKSEADSAGSEENEDDDNSLAKELSVVTSAARNIEDPQVVLPDAHTFSGASTRKSIEWAPEMANIQQLHEFDEAPSVGGVELAAAVTTTSSGSSVTLKLVDPDGHTAAEDSSAKWMVPLRQADASGKVLHWARIGNAVSFNVGSTVEVPCPPTISGAISGNGVVVTVQNYGRSGQDCVPTTSDSVYIPLTSGITRTVVTGAELTSSGLVLTREKHTVLAWTTENPVTVSGTTCEEGGTS